jgi:hypothetical protein
MLPRQKQPAKHTHRVRYSTMATHRQARGVVVRPPTPPTSRTRTRPLQLLHLTRQHTANCQACAPMTFTPATATPAAENA